MKITNLRLGFATNSSSSHSIVIRPGLQDRDSWPEYGWDAFVLASPQAKARYLATALFGHYSYLGVEEAAVLANHAFKLKIPVEEYARGYIDHQSEPKFPKPRITSQGMMPLWEFLKIDLVDNPQVAVLGGNDSEDGPWPAEYLANPYLPYSYLVELDDENPRKYVWDPLGHLAVFDPRDGSRARIVKEGDPDPVRSTWPELLDVKITDACTRNCPHCLENSTPDGQHASWDILESLAWKLRDSGVFEVAVGGGEPTLAPHFPKFLRELKEVGVTPNFSTQNWEWLQDKAMVATVRKCCGAVALSTQDPADVPQWLAAGTKHSFRAHFHYVLGLHPLANLGRFLDALNPDVYPGGHVVLLGYKQVGRAGPCPHDYACWPTMVRAHKGDWTIAVDSVLTDDVRRDLPEVDARRYENADGRFSLYFDAVKGEYAKSSFAGTRVKGTPWDLLEAWQKISNERV